MTTAGLPPPGWYPDPEDPRSQRKWSGSSWQQRRPRHLGAVVVGIIAFLTLQGCATALSQAPTCNPHSPVTTPSTTPIVVTALLWLLGVCVATGLQIVWIRRTWTPRWPPGVLIAASVVLPLVSWGFAAASCGRSLA